MARTYKLRQFRNGQNKDGTAFVNYSITLPTPVAEKLIEEFPDGFEFEIELTAKGILYKPVEPRSETPESLPFTRGKRSDNGNKAPAKPGPKAKTTAAKAKPGPKPKAAAPKAAPKPRAAAKPKPAVAKAKPGPKPAAKAAPKATVRKPGAAKPKATTTKPAAPKPRAPRPKAK